MGHPASRPSWAPGASQSGCGGTGGVSDTMLRYQSCLLGTSESPTALLGPARSCLDQGCLTEPSGMAEMFLHFTGSKGRSSYEGLVQLRN